MKGKERKRKERKRKVRRKKKEVGEEVKVVRQALNLTKQRDENVFQFLGETSFSMTACALFEGLAQNNVLTARITSYNRECPCLELYVPQWSGQVHMYTHYRGFLLGFCRLGFSETIYGNITEH